jgi:polyisoprenoid-binding protein YceI
MMLKTLLLISAGIWLSFFQKKMAPVEDQSKVKFSIKNFGLNVNGSFNGLQGSIVFDPSNLSSSQMDVSIKSTSINTGIDSRDNHLRKKDYFDVTNYPSITVKSRSISAGTTSGTYIFTGTLYIKNVAKDIIFPFTAKSLNPGFQFNGTFPLNRRDFGIGGSSISLSDNLTLYLSIITK